MPDWEYELKYPNPYLPIKSSKGELSLVSFEVCSEGFLRRAIKSGELKHFRNSPRGKILVRLSWFDDWVETQEGEECRIYQQVKRDFQKMWEDAAALDEMVRRDFEKMKEDAGIA